MCLGSNLQDEIRFTMLLMILLLLLPILRDWGVEARQHWFIWLLRSISSTSYRWISLFWIHFRQQKVSITVQLWFFLFCVRQCGGENKVAQFVVAAGGLTLLPWGTKSWSYTFSKPVSNLFSSEDDFPLLPSGVGVECIRSSRMKGKKK